MKKKKNKFLTNILNKIILNFLGVSLFFISCSIMPELKQETMDNKKSLVLPTTLELKKVGNLELSKKDKLKFKIKHVSAASGIEKFNDKFLVVSDDEHFLSTFILNKISNKLGKGDSFQLFSERAQLPEDSKERKRLKPDLEAILKISEDSFLLIPSGSTANREVAVLAEAKNHSNEKNDWLFKQVSFSDIYKELRENYFSELNIEGAALIDDQVLFIQRGNGAKGENGIIYFDFAKFLEQLAEGSVGKDVVQSAQQVILGELKKVPLTFSDVASTKSGKILFLASAEDTKSTYSDGELMGSVLGLLEKKNNQQYQVIWTVPFKQVIKAEGIWIDEGIESVQIFVVSDPDERKKSANLYSLEIPKDWI